MKGSQNQVQGTNDSSIVSKLSMVERGYFADPYIKHFVEKPSRRSPLINRCYYARATAISHCLEGFLSEGMGNTPSKQIVSLGAGFDTSYFRTSQKFESENYTYIEVDFPDVMKRKIALARRACLLPEDDVTELKTERQLDALIYKSGNYIALGFDLRAVGKRLCTLLERVGADMDAPTLFLSEVVLAYLPSEKSLAVIEWVSNEFSNAVFIVFEQATPNDSFGKVMCRHFKQIGGPLLSIDAYPTVSSQVQRHRTLGLQYCNVISLDRFYSLCIDENERRRVEKLEIFDEFEAWHRACQHYFVLCSTNSSLTELRKLCADSFPKRQPVKGSVLAVKELKLKECGYKTLLQRFGHCSCFISDSNHQSKLALVCGGFGIPNCTTGISTSMHQRLPGDIAVIDLQTLQTLPCENTEEAKDLLNFSMFSTLVYSATHSVALLFGGRSSPLKASNSLTRLAVERKTNSDLYIVTVSSERAGPAWPAERWRHSAVMLTSAGRDLMIVFGGRNGSEVFGDCWCYDVEGRSWMQVELEGNDIKARHSHSMCVGNAGESIVISGGLDAEERALDDVYKMHIVNSLCTTAKVVKLKIDVPMAPRFSHTSHVVGNHLLLVGGVKWNVFSEYGDSELGDTVDVFNLKIGSWTRTYRLRHLADAPIMLHNHSSVVVRHDGGGFDLVLLGGGDNCFSFGTWFNPSPVAVTFPCLDGVDLNKSS